MTTTSYKKAFTTVRYNLERTDVVTIIYKEFNGIEIVERNLTMKAWEAENLLNIINKVAFVKLKA